MKNLKTKKYQVLNINKMNFLLLLFVALFTLSCDSDDDPIVTATCDDTNTEFKQLYNQTVASSILNHDIINYDSEIHSYTFEVTTAKTICSVGYQSQPALSTTPYIIEVWDVTSTTPAMVGTVTSMFSSTTTSYVPFTTPIILTVGNIYQVKRIQTNWGTDISNTVGRMVCTVTGAPISTFPFTFGSLKITGSSLYQNAGTQTDWAIPYIDIVFE
jgi:hypothetical protein